MSGRGRGGRRGGGNNIRRGGSGNARTAYGLTPPTVAPTTHFPATVDATFNPDITTLRRNQNAQNLEWHVTGMDHTGNPLSNPFPHFGETRLPVNVSRPTVQQHSYTSEPYPNVMSNINSVTFPTPQTGRGGNSYRSTATLNHPVSTTHIDYNDNTVNTGFTTHIGFYGQGSQRGFDRIATVYTNPPSPQYASPYNTPAYQPQKTEWKSKKP